MKDRSSAVLALLLVGALGGVVALRIGGLWVEGVVDLAVAALVRPAVALDRLGVVEHGVVGVQLVALVAAAALWWLARRWPLALWVAAAPGLGLLGLALGLAPAALCAGLAAAAAVDAKGAEPRWGTAAVAAVIGLVAANGITLLTSGPGDAQTPLELLALVEGLPGRRVWPWFGSLIFLWPAARRSESARGIVAGLACAAVVSVIAPGGLGDAWQAAPVVLVVSGLAAAWGGPSRAVVLPALAGLGALGTVAVHDFGGCDEVRGQPGVEVLSERAGAFAVQPVPGGAFASFRDRGLVVRLGLDGSRVVIDPTHQDLPAWAGQQAAGFDARTAHPEELGLDDRGRVHAFVELPGPTPATALLLLDGTTGEVLEARQDDGRCFVSSWVWSDGAALAGCEWSGRMLRFEGDTWFDGVDVAGGELEELLVQPSGDLLAVGLWSSPWLRRLSVDGQVLDRARVGTFAWGLAPAPEGGAWVARFHGWHLRLVDAELKRSGTRRVGYGVRAVAPWAGGVVAASGYDGHLYVIGEEVRRIRLGGWLRDVDVEADGRHAVVAGVCGVLRVSL